MPSLSGNLNFTYQHGVTRQETFTTQNYYVDVYTVAGLPTWNFTNRDGDSRWMGSSNMPAAASLILYRKTSGSNPGTTPITLYWGSGAHHRHHGGYQLAQGTMVVKVDWQNARITFPNGAQYSDNTGQLPWAPNSSGPIMQQLMAHASDSTVTQAVANQTGWCLVSVGTNGDVGGSMRFDLFVVKATDGFTYLRVSMSESAIGFDSDEEQQYIRFGVLTGDQSGQQLFLPAGEHQASSWNDAAAAALDRSIDTSISMPEDGYAPTEQPQTTGTYTKTTSSGWSIGGALAAGAGGAGGDSGGSPASGGGDAGGAAAGGDDAAAAALVA